MKPKKAIAALSALAHESRLEIFRLLVRQKEAGMAAGVLAETLHIPAATLSFHLSQLSGAGLVKSTKEGRMVIYTASNKRLKKLVKFLTEETPAKTAIPTVTAAVLPVLLEEPHDEEVHEIDIL